MVGAVALLASLNIWLGEGILNTRAGGDSPFLLIRTAELAENLRAGIFPAHWMTHAAYGLGYPFFHFYAALPYYLAASLTVIGVDLLMAIQLTQTAGMFAAAWGMYLFCRRQLGEAGAALAGAAYTLAPFHLVNVYVRGDALSEFWAFVWFPLILLGIDRTIQDAAAHNAAWLALATAALALTHNVSVVLFAPVIVTFAAARLFHHWRAAGAGAMLRALARLAGAGAAALIASSWFWLPAVLDTRLVQLDDQTTGYFHYSNHFRAADLLQFSLLFDYTTDAERTPFSMGLVQAALTVAGAATWGIARRQRRSSTAPWLPMAGFAATTWLITPLSAPLWALITPLQLAQFPWRWLSVQSLFSAWLIGGLAFGLRARSNAMTTHAIPGLAMAALLVAMLWQLPTARLHIRSEDVTTHAIQFYEWYSGNIGTTIRAEYLPRAVRPRPYVGPALLGQPPRALPVEQAAEGDWESVLLSQNPLQQTWRIRLTRPLTLAFPMLDHPRLQVLLDGAPADARHRSADGWAAIALPAGTHLLTLRRAASVVERATLWLAALVTAALTALVAPAAVRRWRAWGFGAATSLAVLVVAWLVSAARAPEPPPMQVVDFARRPFPHRGPVVFESATERYTLVGAAITPSSLRGGDAFTLTLRWLGDRAPAGITLTQELPMGGEFIRLFRYARAQRAANPFVSQHVLLDSPPGPLLLRLQAFDANGAPLQPSVNGDPVSAEIAGAPAPAITLVGPIVQAAPTSAASPSLITFSNGIALQHVDWFHISQHEVCIRPQWRRLEASAPRAGAWQASLRLIGSDGRLVAQADSQPHGGLAPTWSWQPGQTIPDSQCVPLVNVERALRPGEPYTLEIVWYRLSDLQPLDRATLRGTRGVRLEDLHEPQP